MEQYVLSTVKQMWVFYFLLLAVGELLLYAKQKKGVGLEILIAILIIILLVAHGQYELNIIQPLKNQYLLRATVDILSLLMPLAVLIVSNQFIVKLKHMAARHISLIVIVIVTVTIWPFYAIYITCASGLDCL